MPKWSLYLEEGHCDKTYIITLSKNMQLSCMHIAQYGITCVNVHKLLYDLVQSLLLSIGTHLHSGKGVGLVISAV